jgi:cation:H+ antiporter
MTFASLPFPYIAAMFALATPVITFASTKLTILADRLADRTGWGEAAAGGVLLGASTSLSGMVASATAASQGFADLALANAIGGIAAQTSFLAVADMVYRKANLEHAAASLTNLNQATLLVVLLALPLTIAVLPPVTLFGLHPVSFAIAAIYLHAQQVIRASRLDPMWTPTVTSETRHDLASAEDTPDRPSLPLLLPFLMLALVVSAAGWLLANLAPLIAAQTGLSRGTVGALFIAVATSMPELVTTIAAGRRGALQLAVGGIIGGNTFDVLFLVVSDAAYGGGSVYHAAGPQFLFWLSVSILMTGVLLLGLLRREPHGPANIGFEGIAIIAIYGGAILASAFGFAGI